MSRLRGIIEVAMSFDLPLDLESRPDRLPAYRDILAVVVGLSVLADKFFTRSSLQWAAMAFVLYLTHVLMPA